jgi:hypothetical protein
LGEGSRPNFDAAFELAKLTSHLGELLYPDEAHCQDEEPTPEEIVDLWNHEEEMEHELLFNTPESSDYEL